MHTPVRMSTLFSGFCGYVYVSCVKVKSVRVEVLKVSRWDLSVKGAKTSSLAGLEPTRNNSNQLIVGCLNHSVIVSNT